MIEKPTPVATPATAKPVCRTRADMGPGDVENEIHGVSAMRTRAPSLRSVAAGEATRSPSFSPSSASTARVPRMPILTQALAHAVAGNDEDRVAAQGVGRDEQRLGAFAGDDIGLDAHARLERRIGGQRHLDTVGLGDDVAHWRDFAYLAFQPAVGKRVSAEQHGLLQARRAVCLLRSPRPPPAKAAARRHGTESARPRRSRRFRRRGAARRRPSARGWCSR